MPTLVNRAVYLGLLAAALLLCLVPSAFAQLPYTVTVEPLENQELTQALKDSSNLWTLVNEPPPSIVGLIRRAESDVERIDTAMRAFGYYRAKIVVTIEGKPLDDPELQAGLAERDETELARAPVLTNIAVAPGPRYILDAVLIEGVEISAEERESLGLKPGDDAASAAILRAEAQLIDIVKKRGYPFAAVPDRRVVVDYATQKMTVTYRVDPGPRAGFGSVTIAGLERMDERIVRNRIPFEAGDQYDPAKLDRLRTNLGQLDVFSSVLIRTPESLPPDGLLPVAVTVAERERRFAGFGADYSTTDGFGARAYWGHRNLFGGGERIRLEGSVARIIENAVPDFGLRLDFRKPDVLLRNQDLLAAAALATEETDAYERRAATASVGFEYKINDRLSVGYGVSAEQSRITDDDSDGDSRTRDFTFFGVPLNMKYDASDNLLDPTQGFRIALTSTPYPIVAGPAKPLVVNRATGSGYLDFDTKGRYVLAGRLSLGSILGGGKTDDIPADKRFFAGGGGSIRGFAYQSVGPRNRDNDPSGGRSLFEGSIEGRIRVGQQFGIVPFLDFGTVFDKAVPTFDETVRFGAGLGGRYYSPFGPIRLDVAVPLNRDKGDDRFAIYVSIGQAF